MNGEDWSPNFSSPLTLIQFVKFLSNTINLEFTLDRTLITNGDTMQLNLERIGGDGADTYGSDIGVGQSGILLESVTFN